jgi:hypothetical protein
MWSAHGKQLWREQRRQDWLVLESCGLCGSPASEAVYSGSNRVAYLGAFDSSPDSWSARMEALCSSCLSTTRHCCRCKNRMPLENFSRSGGAGRLNSRCRPCHAEYTKSHYLANTDYYKEKAIRNRPARHIAYGLTDAAFQRLLDNHSGCCGICGQDVDPLVIDHDHSNGRVRGLLCGNCNRGLGFFKDTPDYLRSAAAYLEVSPTPSPEDLAPTVRRSERASSNLAGGTKPA